LDLFVLGIVFSVIYWNGYELRIRIYEAFFSENREISSALEVCGERQAILETWASIVVSLVTIIKKYKGIIADFYRWNNCSS